MGSTLGEVVFIGACCWFIGFCMGMLFEYRDARRGRGW